MGMCNVKHSKLSTVGLAVAFGIVSALMMLVLAWTAWQSGMGTSIVTEWSSVYPGFAPTMAGGLAGAAWGFLEGFIFGLIFGCIYNLCVHMCCGKNACGCGKPGCAACGRGCGCGKPGCPACSKGGCNCGKSSCPMCGDARR